MCDDVWRGVLADVLIFSCQTLGSGCWRHCEVYRRIRTAVKKVEGEFSYLPRDSEMNGKKEGL